MEQNGHPVLEIIEEEEQVGWIVTFADLMTLLLVFFVVLYSISSLNLAKFKRAMASIQISLGEARPAVGLLDLTGAPESLDQKISVEDLSGLRSRELEAFKEINEFIEEKRLGRYIVAHVFKGKIIIQIRGKILFESGSAVLNSEAKPVLDKIIRIISEYSEYKVNIKGHTDNVPISTEKFASNWELSAIRATMVLKYLIEGGIDPVRLTATGYGELFPFSPNNSDENRAMNRRVEFVLEKRAE
ncbi:MAG: flagellar motor protein MotB [Pseudomonadota bacterium]